MKFTLTTRLAAATGVTAVLLGGLVPPVAQADPIPASPALSFGELSGTGSDTTQDVMNGMQVALGRATNGLWKLASYDATWSADATPATSGTIQTKSDGNTAIGRPNGSGDGLESLAVSIGQAATHTGTRFGGAGNTWASDGGINDVIGDVQFSRSSSGPTIVTDGAVSYVPFAKDALGYAISANSVMPALTVGSSSDAAIAGVTPSSLWAIYNCSATRIITKTGATAKLVNDSYTLADGESSTRIRAYLPQSSSGTAKFWQGATGAKFANPTPANLFNCVERRKFVAGDAGDVSGGNNTFTSGADYTGIEVQEHSGLAVQNDPGAITPFSIPNWVAMSKGLPGVTDRRFTAVLGVLNGVAATRSVAGTLSLNPDFLTNTYTSYLSRSVYNVVPYRLVTDPSTLEYKMFKGRTSLVCSQSSVIANYGYGLLTATSGVNSCGDTSQRALAPSTPTVSGATGVADDVNGEYDFEVTGFASNGTAGAKVYVVATSTTSPVVTYTANSATPATIAAGATAATFSLPYSAVRTGSWKLGLQIVPNLPGIASVVKDNSGTGLVTRAATTVTTTTATVAGGRVNVAGSAVVRVTAAVGTPTGTVKVYLGTSATGSSIAQGTLVSGAVTITLPAQTTKGKKNLFFVYSGDATNAASTKAVTWVIK